jgi:[acyl-carrier-protein] S-malonyltransferase
MIAFIFPGQGSQSVGMARDLYEGSATAKRVLDEIAAALDFPLLQLMFEGPAEALTLTQNAQPALLAHAAAATALLREGGVTPGVVAGHSLGEYAALMAAGCLEPVEAARLVRARGEIMAEIGSQVGGTMAAVLGLGPEAVAQVVVEAAQVGVVCPANLNSPEQVVISGEEAAVRRAGELATAAGAKRVVPLSVSGGFHSPVMRPAAERFAAVLAQAPLRNAAVPLVSNVDATARQDAGGIREALLAQLTGAVRWHDCTARMVQRGATAAVEVGPGKVLTNLWRRAYPELSGATAGDMAGVAAAVEEFGQ